MARNGAKEGESLSQADLAKHLADMTTGPTARLDGEAWDEVSFDVSSDEVTQTFEMKAAMRRTAVETILVQNDYNTFAPYQCKFAPGSHPDFSHDPAEGSMNRRSGEPTEITVRFSPKDNGAERVAALVFETEDMKKVYMFIGKT